jgi:hypothetical protein
MTSSGEYEVICEGIESTDISPMKEDLACVNVAMVNRY